jgi:hypothetical protein
MFFSSFQLLHIAIAAMTTYFYYMFSIGYKVLHRCPIWYCNLQQATSNLPWQQLLPAFHPFFFWEGEIAL